MFAALVRAATWPSWSPIDAVEIEGGGDPGERQQAGDTRTDIRWTAAFEPKRRFSGPFWRWCLKRFMQRMADGLAAYAATAAADRDTP